LAPAFVNQTFQPAPDFGAAPKDEASPSIAGLLSQDAGVGFVENP
jgi:hypothetical protein